MSESTQYPWEFVEAGQYQKAIEMYTRMYERDARLSHLFNRGLAYLAAEDYISALEDFKLITVLENPRFLADDDYIFQGICYWYLDQPSEAVEVWRQSLKAPYTDAAGGVERSALLLYAAERLQDRELRKEALGLLRKHWRNHQQRLKRRQKRAELGRKQFTHQDFVHPGLFGWPGVIVPFLLGKVGVSGVQQQVMSAGHEILRGRWQCQADFYIGLRALREEDRAGFEAGMTRCAGSFYGLLEHEYCLARWEVQHSFPEVAFA